MKKLIIILLLITTANLIPNEIDTIWYRTMGAYATDVDFTPDDKYVVAWANGIELWEVQEGRKDFYIPSQTTGDYNYNKEYLVIVQDSTPKLFNWETREVVEGFEKAPFEIDRIKTAKSKNEFMAKQQGDSNYIYFWNINTKQRIDEVNFGYSFKKEGYRWKRTLHEYGYVGNNDQYFYVIISDANNVLETIPSDFHKHHYYVNFYDKETKELVDSVYSFTNTNEQFGGFNKLKVMKNRDHIAWNKEGGVIRFYDVINKRFYNKLVFDERDYIEATDIHMSNDDNYIILTNRNAYFLRIYNTNSKSLIHEYDKGSFQNASFSNNSQYLVANIGSWLILFPSHITQSNINEESTEFKFSISPNPADSRISINFGAEVGNSYDLSLIDLSGNEVGKIDSGIIDTEQYTIDYDISQLPAGVYFVRLDLGGEVITRKFVKE